MDCSLWGSSIHGIVQARVLEWVVISFSKVSSQPRDQTHISHIAGRHFTIWTNREDKIESESFSVVSKSLQPHGLHSSWNSLGQNTGVGSLSLLQGNFPIQGLNPGLPHCWCILYQLSHNRSPAGKSGGHGEGSCWRSQGLPGLHRNWIQEHYKKE